MLNHFQCNPTGAVPDEDQDKQHHDSRPFNMSKSHYAGRYLFLFDYLRKIHIGGKSHLLYGCYFILDGFTTHNQKISAG